LKSPGGKAEQEEWRALTSESSSTESRATWHSSLGRRAGESFLSQSRASRRHNTEGEAVWILRA
jgi:hypothetical protein